MALRGWLELQLATTRFSRTTLDGYREHTTEERWQTIELCENVPVRPGQSYVYSTTLHIPESPPPHSRPVKMRWQAKAGIEPQGRREFSATAGIRDVTLPQGGAPAVDGRGFLPLYEFRAKAPAPEPPICYPFGPALVTTSKESRSAAVPTGEPPRARLAWTWPSLKAWLLNQFIKASSDSQRV